MQLDSLDLYKKLKDIGISYLYHANSLTTSLGFIRNGGLLSRGEMEKRGISQTVQDSDSIDQEFNVWNDIFLDTVDLHGYLYSKYSRQNLYGPVLFILRLELLLDTKLKNVWITNNNPINWAQDDNEDNRYFCTVDEYIQEIHINRQQKMITIRNLSIPVSFDRYLKCIKLDDPKIAFSKPQVDVFEYAYNKLQDAVNSAKLNTGIEKHECASNCYCIQNYRKMPDCKFNKYFFDYSVTDDKMGDMKIPKE